MDEAPEGLLAEALALDNVVDVREAEGELQVLVGTGLQAVTTLNRLSVQQKLGLDALSSGQRLTGVAVEAKALCRFKPGMPSNGIFSVVAYVS